MDNLKKSIFTIHCPRCDELNERKDEDVFTCKNCGYKIFFNEASKIFFRFLNEAIDKMKKEKEDGQFL